ncbi:MAG TPA: L,D-transpeptidase family protein [Chthoniobacterales bacterium]|nr:L,D-transpeptidase family protein [Chthoniobacterales bacterium]
MIKTRLVGSAICLAFVGPGYGHDSTASPTPTPAVYQNATANTFSGSAPSNGLRVPTGGPSPTRIVLPKATPDSVSPLLSSAAVKPQPSPRLAKVAASPAAELIKAAPTPAPKLAKAVASLSPDPSEIVGPPAPRFIKALALSQPKAQNSKANAPPSPTLANAVASPQPKLLKAVASTSTDFIRPSQSRPLTKPPPAAAPSLSPGSQPPPTPEPEVKVVVSVRDQKLAVVVNGKIYRSYKISTSRYGEGDNFGSWQTPLGHLQVATKIGGAAPAGAVFRRRQPTGEILAANAPGRDPIISRIIWLRGTGAENRRAFQRCIYIHGTPQEAFLGRKASYGCIRMRSSDVIEVFNWVGIGTDVAIVDEPIRRAVKGLATETMVARNDQKRTPESVGSPSEANR